MSKKKNIEVVEISDISDDDTIPKYKSNNIQEGGKENKVIKNKVIKSGTKNIAEVNYKRPINTFTDLLSKKDIQNKLIDYEKVDKVDENIIGYHCRYFELKDGEYKFRVGGFITIGGFPDYVMMTNGQVTWSVQVKNCIFFKRLTIKSIRDEYDKVIIDKDNQINELTSYIRKLQKEINILKKK
jgi:hypothetical protein